QAEEEAEQFVGRVGAEPDQGHQQAVTLVKAVRMAGAGGTAAGGSLACGPSGGTQLLSGALEVGQEGVKLGGGHAREAAEGSGETGQRVVLEHGASSGLPLIVERSCTDD